MVADGQIMTTQKILLGVSAAFVALLFAGVIWLDAQFEEPEARTINSVAGELGAKSVLAIFAHPDDEQLITGLLIRANKRDGAVTRIITATKGDAGTQMPQVARQEELGVIRHAELLKNGYALGVQEQLVWDYPDGGVAAADFETYVTRIEDQLTQWKPDLVVTFWPESGFSNHSDHKATGRAAVEAVMRRRQKSPDAAPRAIAYILAPRRMMHRFGGDAGKTIAANQPAPTHAMPGEGWAKIRGWKIHASQKDFVRTTYGMPPFIVHRLYDKEHYLIDAIDG